ncbi:hypothetical protein MKW92_002180 [Papaver armeniacum]|nr:hypothetical protein MKW92_002180 [Papaver armeniacum]
MTSSFSGNLGIPSRQRNSFISAVQVPFISEVVGSDGEVQRECRCRGCLCCCDNIKALWELLVEKIKELFSCFGSCSVVVVVVVMVIDEAVGVVPHCQGNSRLCALALLQICYSAVCLFNLFCCFRK